MYVGATPLPEPTQTSVQQELKQTELFEYPTEEPKIEVPSRINDKNSKEIKSSAARNIKKIIVFYDDDTYQELI